MEQRKIVIRPATKLDYPFILRVNEENVEVLSPMDEQKLEYFSGCAEMLYVALVDDVPAAFLIVLREGIDSYGSENYRWFSRNYERFLYIDRIVIDEPFRRMGLGKKLYDEVFAHAKKTDVGFVTAEIDTIPYNETSLGFHRAMGFVEVGVQVIRGGTIKVSLQEAKVK
ncbi:MAG: GNAT family N-acetyltransferase [Clostridia bacterium]|nr:GNAT family N-acetyltransferase [Clostridia bacterium]